MDGRRLVVVLSSCVVVVLTACTSTTAKPTPHPTSTATAHVVLKCAEGNSDGPSIAPNLRLTDTVGTVFARNPVSDIPRAKDVGIPSPSSAEWKFNKSPLLLADAAGQVTIGVPDDGRQFLLWVPTAVWVNGSSPADKKPWIAHQVTAHGCTSTGVTFLGGVLARDPTRCFTLTMESPSGLRNELNVRADGNSCQQ